MSIFGLCDKFSVSARRAEISPRNTALDGLGVAARVAAPPRRPRRRLGAAGYAAGVRPAADQGGGALGASASIGSPAGGKWMLGKPCKSAKRAT